MQTTAGDELDSSPSRSAVDSTISSASHSSEKATVSPDTAVLEKGMTIDDAPILAPMDRGFKAWRFIASGFFIDGLVWGLTFSFGSYQDYYVSSQLFDASPVAFSVIGTSALALDYALLLPGIILCRMYPQLIQVSMRVCLVGYVVSLLVASFAGNIATLIIFQGFLPGMFGGLMWAPIYVYLNEWFKERISLAGGLIFAGAAFAGFIFPLIIASLTTSLGFRWSLRIFAVVILLFGGVALQGIVAREPIIRPLPGAKMPRVNWAFLFDPIFYVVLSIIFLQGGAYSSISVYLPSYASPVSSAIGSGLALSAANLAAMFGQIASGYLCDRFPYTAVMSTCLLMMIISIFSILRVVDILSKVIAFACFVGFFGGGFSSTWFPASRDVNSLVKTGQAQAQGEIFALISITRGVSSIVGPTIAGVIYSNSRTGDHGLQDFVKLTGFLSVGALVVVGILELVRRRRRSTNRGKEEAETE